MCLGTFKTKLKTQLFSPVSHSWQQRDGGDIGIDHFKFYCTALYRIGIDDLEWHWMLLLRSIGVASYGALGHVPPPPSRLSASYFGDHSLYRLWRVMRTVFCPVERFLAIGSADGHWIVALLCSRYRCPPNPPPAKILREQIRKMYKNNAIFAQFYQFLAHFCHFLPTVFVRE